MKGCSGDGADYMMGSCGFEGRDIVESVEGGSTQKKWGTSSVEFEGQLPWRLEARAL